MLPVPLRHNPSHAHSNTQRRPTFLAAWLALQLIVAGYPYALELDDGASVPKAHIDFSRVGIGVGLATSQRAGDSEDWLCYRRFPIIEPAPGRFSPTTDCCNFSCSFSAMIRAARGDPGPALPAFLCRHSGSIRRARSVSSGCSCLPSPLSHSINSGSSDPGGGSILAQ